MQHRKDCLIENVPKDFVAVYHNVVPYEEVTDRLYSGGVLENVYDPYGWAKNEFVFRKIWTGYTGVLPEFTWTLYRNGVKDEQQVPFILDEEGIYHVYPAQEGEYSLVENVPKGFVAVYHNIAPYENVTDRLYSGGVLENVYARAGPAYGQ